MRHTGFHGVPDTGESQVDHVLPDVLANLVQLVAEGPDTGVRDNDVEPAEVFHTAVDGGFDCLLVADVHLRGDDAPVEGFDQVGGLGEILRRRVRVGQVIDRPANVDRDDVGALLRQAYRVTAALPTSGATDEGDSAFDPAGHQDTNVGRVSQPRTDDVGLSVAFARSGSHSGKRLRISSRATRPSSRANAEPRQKWAPTLNVRGGRAGRWMLNSPASGPNCRASRQAAPISIII